MVCGLINKLLKCAEIALARGKNDDDKVMCGNPHPQGDGPIRMWLFATL